MVFNLLLCQNIRQKRINLALFPLSANYEFSRTFVRPLLEAESLEVLSKVDDKKGNKKNDKI